VKSEQASKVEVRVPTRLQRRSGRGEAFRAHIINYADDFVILSQRYAAEALAWTKAVMAKLGLTLNEVKTSVKDARAERFDFLGYALGPHCYQRNGKRYLGASPSEKSVKRMKTKIDDVLVPGNMQPWTDVCNQLNGLLRGWSASTSADASDISSVGGIKCPAAGPSDSRVT
jgi:RNA-directed DNA polymerase